MSKEKLLVLQMLKEGKISEEEALKLLEAMGEDKNTKKNIGENKFKFLEDDFVSKITDSIASIGRRTQEAIQKINIEETISDIGSTFQNLRERLNKYLTTIWKRVEMLIQLRLKITMGKLPSTA